MNGSFKYKFGSIEKYFCLVRSSGEFENIT